MRRNGAARRPSTRRLKQVLLSLMVVGALGSITIHRTYAVLSGEAQNNGTKIASGTLTFNLTEPVQTNTGGTGRVCYSWKANGGGQVNDPADAQPGNSSYFLANTTWGCDPLFVSTALWYPGSSQAVEIQIQNDGSLPAGDLTLYMPGTCTTVNTPTAGDTIHNGADLCIDNGASTGPYFWVQEWTNSSYNVAKSCWYPAGAGACNQTGGSLWDFQHNYSSGGDPNDPNQTNCSSGSPGADCPAGGYLDLGAGPQAFGQTGSATSTYGASDDRYFTIGMALPTTAPNTYQGEAAQFELGWIMSSD